MENLSDSDVKRKWIFNFFYWAVARILHQLFLSSSFHFSIRYHAHSLFARERDEMRKKLQFQTFTQSLSDDFAARCCLIEENFHFLSLLVYSSAALASSSSQLTTQQNFQLIVELLSFSLPLHNSLADYELSINTRTRRSLRVAECLPTEIYFSAGDEWKIKIILTCRSQSWSCLDESAVDMEQTVEREFNVNKQPTGRHLLNFLSNEIFLRTMCEVRSFLKAEKSNGDDFPSHADCRRLSSLSYALLKLKYPF